MVTKADPPSVANLLCENYALKQDKLALAKEIRKLVRQKADAEAKVITTVALLREQKRLAKLPPAEPMTNLELARRLAFAGEIKRRGLAS